MFIARSLIAVVPFALALALGGCSSESSGDAGPAAEAEVNSSGPVTLANYANHPTVRAIRTEVSAVDGMALEAEDHVSCDVTSTKFEAAGKVRKVRVFSGEADFDVEQLAYFRESGKLLFLYAKENNHTGEAAPGQETTETRAYFDANGKQIIQVRRVGTEPDAIPGHDNSYDFDGTETWQKYFQASTCNG